MENLLHNHDILTRTELANALGVARSTVYRTFDDDWSGEPSMTMLARMAGHFRVPLNRIVTEPGRTNTRRRNVRLAG
ncbi:Cro protein [Mycobacterium phage Archie]|uniref:Cro protein n=1 Tax=Mycobacterium phage Archie TaxID=1718599 RepID=A0A0M4S2U1_9CAUD|nr:transcriptional repressor [Mycobacterium phage Archie]ALF00347.1 Cro protein [Mycobacterium phage Archie]